jgi:FkbM family methyltransferase
LSIDEGGTDFCLWYFGEGRPSMSNPNEPARKSASGGPLNSALHRGIRVNREASFDVVTEAMPEDPISQSLAKGILPELCRPLIELVESMVRVGGRVLDLGSHIGTFALSAAAMGRKVVAIEASPRNFELLAASIEANHFDSLRLVHAAVSDRAGALRFFANGPFGHVAADGVNDGVVTVPALAVDDLLKTVGWDRVDFVKLDIEGSEIAGLLGMSGLLNRADAPPIFVESNGHTLHMFGESPRTLKATLIAYGYQLFHVEHRRLIPVGLDDFQGSTTVDYLAVKAVPAIGRQWRFDGPMKTREQIRRVRESCLSPIPELRRYAARSIGHAPAAIRSDWRIVEAVDLLKVDRDPEVRRAAAPLALSATTRPWYRFWS